MAAGAIGKSKNLANRKICVFICSYLILLLTIHTLLEPVNVLVHVVVVCNGMHVNVTVQLQKVANIAKESTKCSNPDILFN